MTTNGCPDIDCPPDCQERAECTETAQGHTFCGMCADHGKPRHACGCVNPALRDVVGTPVPWFAPTPVRPTDARLWPL